MKLPAIRGSIRRRMLVNYSADADVVARLLPPPFRPKLHREQAIVGICLIRLENMRPAALPLPFGFRSENAAHRIAVVWNAADGTPREGVFIPRRDTNSAWNHLAGGRLFPGEHHLARFRICDDETGIEFRMRSRDLQMRIELRARQAATLPADSLFGDLAEASRFFETGCTGFSPRCDSQRLDGLVLKTATWQVDALDVFEVRSSYYDDTHRFPAGSIRFDHALLMRNIEHTWDTAPEPPSTLDIQAPLHL